ncbi:MAG: hypothetical protein AAGJ50_00955, partial [Pseudomonadota bacterium]
MYSTSMLDRSLKSFLISTYRGVNDLDKSIERQVYSDMYHRLLTVMPPLSLITALNALAASMAYSYTVDLWILAPWSGVLCLISAAQYFSAKKLRKRAFDPSRVSKTFVRHAGRNAAFFGAWWGLSVVLFQGSNEVLNVILIVAGTGMCLAAGASGGAITNVGSRFAFGCMPLVILGALFQSPYVSFITIFLGISLVSIGLYVSHLKLVDTVEKQKALMLVEDGFSMLK